MFRSRNFSILLLLSNIFVVLLVPILSWILKYFDILKSVGLGNFLDISNSKIIFSLSIGLLIKNLIAILIHSNWRDESVTIDQINIQGVKTPRFSVPLSIFVSVAFFILFVLGLAILSPQLNIGLDPDNEQQKPVLEVDSLYFGYIPDASPISSKNGEHFSGYCKELMYYLEKEKHYKFKEAEIKYPDRFQRKAKEHDSEEPIPEDNLIIECSANTITEDRKREIYEKGGGYFSEPFAKTGAKLLIRKELRDRLNPQGFNLPLQGEKIGILGKTTTISLIKSVYTKSKFKSYTNRGKVINALNKGELKIYPSDSILLKDMLENQLKNKDQYFIWPEHFLSHENYGVVVYGVYKDYKDKGYDSDYRKYQDEKKQFDGDYAELLNIINEWINDEALGKKVYKEQIEQFAQ